MNKIQITGFGLSEAYENNNKTPKRNKIEWKGEYNGKNAKINMNINGKKSQISMTNEDLINLLSRPVDNNLISERLSNDFLFPIDKQPMILYKEQTQPISMSQMISMTDNFPILKSKIPSYSKKAKKRMKKGRNQKNNTRRIKRKK